MEEGTVVARFGDMKKVASDMGFGLRAFHNGGFQLWLEDEDESVLLADSLEKVAGFLEGVRFAADRSNKLSEKLLNTARKPRKKKKRKGPVAK